MKQKRDTNFIEEEIVLRVCNDLKELVTGMINYKGKESQKVCHICKEKFCYDKSKQSEFKRYHMSYMQRKV